MWQRACGVCTYSVCYFAAIAAVCVLSFLLARRRRLEHRTWIAIGASFLFGMTVGAKALFDLRAGMFTFGGLISIDHYLRGGLWGGPLVYLLPAAPLVWCLSRRKAAAVDLTVLVLPAPLIIAKIGCLLHGCCYGEPCSLPWAITFPQGNPTVPGGVPMHPTQVYEMIVLACIGVVMWRLDRRRWEGTLLFWFLAMYGIGRPLTEFFRGDLHDQNLLGPFTHSQWICATAALVAVVILIVLDRSAKRRTARLTPSTDEQRADTP